MHRILIAGVAIAATAAAFVATASGQTAPTTIHLVDHTKGFAYNDVKPKGLAKQKASLGDQFYITGKLTGDQTGTDALVCTVIVAGKHGAEYCTGIAHLTSGDVMFAGRVTDNDAPDDLAVVGGTGAYAGARGTVHTTNGAHDTTDITLTFTL
jgi:hypothetical protein